ncbi:MAG: hypothetical protein HKN15_11510 [Xanthomonadales bacterium]|nr:hypothetical protein [Xanthomonadales bacterium]
MTLIVIVVLAALAWWRWPETQPGAQPETERVASQSSGVAVLEQPTPPAPNAEPQEADTGETRSALEQYKERTRYPATTRRLSEDSFDLLNPGARHENRQALPGEDALGWEVLYTADRFFVRGSEPVLVSLQLWHRGEAVLPAQVSLVANAEGGNGDAAPVRLAVQTDGKAATAVFEPDRQWSGYVGKVRVRAQFSAEGLSSRSGELDFFFTGSERIPATFTGAFRDRLGDGDLLIDVGLDVKKEGVFRVEGNLFDANGQPFGWARFEGPLAPGASIATLRFYGLLFHDAQAQGPYTLRDLRGFLMQPGHVPDRADIPELAGGWQTEGHYPLEGFRSEENHSARRQRMIEMYEDAERRGVRLTRPEYTGDG